MTLPTFTRGPWKVYGEAIHPIIDNDSPNGGFAICGAFYGPDAAMNRFHIVQIHNQLADMTQVLAGAGQAVDRIWKAFGAPGDHGYSTPQGQALFELYKLRGALDSLLRASEPRA